MNQYLLLAGVVIIACILLHRVTDRLGIPSLLAFLLLGMCFGIDGIFHIPFNNYQVAEVTCSVCLVFIMFYGGFGTNLKEARSVAGKSILLSTLGVLFTASLVGIFVHMFFSLGWAESMLIGSVISSTDAASVFSILRSKKLNLKEHTASLLELESGSNDPMSYMLTFLFTTIMLGKDISVPIMLVRQIGIGLLAGLLIGKIATSILNGFSFHIDQGNTIFVFATAILAYALPSILGGNGYLSVYIAGVFMGSMYLPEKRNLVLFFDVLTGVSQMLIFFLLGLLVTPSQLPAVFLPALLIMVALTFLARPIAVSVLLLPSGSSMRQAGLVSWAGLRGAASIVFAIQAVLSGASMHYNLFNLVFCIVLISIATQGSLLAPFAHKLDMIDENSDVRRTFNDYREDTDVIFTKISVPPSHPWANLPLKTVPIPSEFLVVLILRAHISIVPNGDTVILPGDLLIIAGQEFEDRENLTLYEISIGKGHKWRNKTLQEISPPAGTLIVMIKGENGTVIPDGRTVIHQNDTLVVAKF